MKLEFGLVHFTALGDDGAHVMKVRDAGDQNF